MIRRFAWWPAALLLLACSHDRTDTSSAVGATVPASTSSSGVGQIARSAHAAPPVLFVGLDGADWQLLDDYINAGSMPNLARIVREGTSGVLETIRPPLSPLVWTTMMTGVSPVSHGILDFVQFDPETGQKEPITSSLRRVPAVWNMATDAGKRTAVFGLWATYPAETVNGVVVSDRLFTFLFKESAPPPGVVFPADREAWARGALDRAEQETGLAALKSYLPWLTDAEYRAHVDSPDPYGHPISALRRILIETRVYDELGRDAFARDHPDLTIVYLQGTDSIGHVFAPFAPPKQAAVSDADYERYHSVPEQYFKAIDAFLGAYVQLAESSHAVLMLASDHGFLWKEGRPATLSSNAMTTAAKWHRNEGIYAVWGPGIKATPGHTGRGSVDQVAATLLALTGLPADTHGQAAVLPGAPAASSERVDYQAAYHPAVARGGALGGSDADALKKLKSLGYISDTGSTASGRAGETRTPGSFNNEGVYLREHGQPSEAIGAFEKAIAADPNLASALWNLSDMLFGQKDFDRSDDLLVRSFKSGLPEGTKFLVGRAIGYQRAGQTDRSLKLVSAALDVKPDDPELWLFRGRYRVEAGDCKGAAADFQKAERLEPARAATFASEGLAWACAGDPANARKALTHSLDLDPNQPTVRDFLKNLGRTP
jgi:Tfp pilus assembly protein PilF